jgi:hypothetical protein
VRRLFDPLFGPVAFQVARGRPTWPEGGAVDPFSLFTQDMDWRVPSVKGGPQSFSGSPAAGNDFRQGGNAVVCYAPNVAGTLSAMSSTAFRRTDRGEWQYPSINVSNLWNRDLTNAAWVKTNATVAKNQTGAEGSANAASSITATAANATVIQSITSIATNRVFQALVRRISGTGTLEFTLDGGTTWTIMSEPPASFDVMNPLVINQNAVTNPAIGFRVGTSGDVFGIDFASLYTQPTNYPALTPILSQPITTSASVQTFLERAYASFPDSSPLATIARGAFGFYLQQRGYPNHPITSASNLQLSVDNTGIVKLQNGASGQCVTGAGAWKNGLTQMNKIAGWCDAGNLVMAVNGVMAGAATGTLGLDAALDHWDLGTNGSGANSIFGINERVCMGSNLTFTNAQLIAMTT